MKVNRFYGGEGCVISCRILPLIMAEQSVRSSGKKNHHYSPFSTQQRKEAGATIMAPAGLAGYKELGRGRRVAGGAALGENRREVAPKSRAGGSTGDGALRRVAGNNPDRATWFP